MEVWGLSRLRRALPVWLRPLSGAHAPGSRTHSHPPQRSFDPATAGLVEVWGLSRLRRTLPVWLRILSGAHAPGSRTHSHPPQRSFDPATAGLVEVWGLSRLRRTLPVWLRILSGAHAPGSQTHSHPRKGHLIPLPRDWWRYGDYPDCVGLCQCGCAFSQALTRRAVKHILIPSKGHLIPLPRDWWRYGDSNPRPSHCERDALPAELYPQPN